MPYGYGYSQQRRGSGSYTPPSYGGETVLAEVLSRINGQLEDRSMRKEQEAREQEEREKEMRQINANVTIAGAMASNSVEEGINKTKEEDARRKAIDALAKRYASGDRTAASGLIMAGVPESAIKYLGEPEKKPTLAEQAYERRTGTLKADKEFGVGAFKPEKPKGAGGPPRAMSMTEANRMARAAAGTHLRDAFEYAGPNASPTAAVIQAAVMDPAYAGMTQDPNFVRALQAEVARSVREEQAKRNKAGGGRGATSNSFDAASEYLKKNPPK